MSIDNLVKHGNSTYNDLLSRLELSEDTIKRQILLEMGYTKEPRAYKKLLEYIETPLRHQAMIGMANIDYMSTIDIFVSILKKENKLETKNKETISCIFGDRIEKIGEDEFINELKKYFTYFELPIKKIFYETITDCIRFTNIKKYDTYLEKIKTALVI